MHVRKTAFAVVAGAALIAAGIFFTSFGCQAVDGRWGNVAGSCVTPICFYLGGCGEWVGPAVPCDSIPLGTSEARVHFLLGDSRQADNDARYWVFGKGTNFTMQAKLVNGYLTQLSCGNPRWTLQTAPLVDTQTAPGRTFKL